MGLLLNYSLRNLRTRKLTTILTAGGMALVSSVFAAVLMLAEGLEQTLRDTGSPENAIILRGSAETEISSLVSRDEASIVEIQPEVTRSEMGDAFAAKESVVLVALPKRSSGSPTNVMVRGVGSNSSLLRPQVRLVAGRYFRHGAREIIIGRSIAQRIEEGILGGTLHFALSDWTIVGILDAGGAGFDSEVWGDANQLMAAFRRNSYSSVTVRVPGDRDFSALKKRLESDPRLSVQVKREIEFYKEQSDVMARFIRILGTGMTTFFSIGAILGAMVTMYTAVAARTREIGALRALGFGRWTILAAFLAESLLLGLMGGAAGIACSSLLQFSSISTVNWGTFSELVFGFKLTVTIALYTLGFGAAMGILGGILPAWRAAGLNIVDALRAS